MTKLETQIKKAGISRTALASKLGRRISTVSMAVKHGVKTRNAARRYAKALNCDPREIIEF